jgi:hypothetical protein
MALRAKNKYTPYAVAQYRCDSRKRSRSLLRVTDVNVLNIQPEMVERHARPRTAPLCTRFGVWERLAYTWRTCKGLLGGLEGYIPIELFMGL